jgi:hypothetical protein
MDVSAAWHHGRRDPHNDSASGLGATRPGDAGVEGEHWPALLPIYARPALRRPPGWPGLNWTFDPTIGVSYNNRTGLNAAAYAASA